VPSKSGKQHRLMALVANDPKAAKRLGIPQKVGKEYVKADKGKKFASGGMSRPAALERRRQREYLERNPQYAEREEGLESVYPEEFMTPGGASKAGSGVMAAVKEGMYRNPAAKRAADKAMRERIKEAESKKDKLRATSPASAPYKSPNRSPYEPRPQSDESSYRKGGSVKSSASRRADGIAQRGKTRGKFI
jgi:hypothetical protein